MRIFSVIILAVIILLGDALTGFGATVSQPGDVQQFQQGVCNTTSGGANCNNCSIPDSFFPSRCQILVTFPAPFTSVPNHVSASFIGINGTVSHSDTTVGINSFTFQADNGETWTSMPAAQTEIYGTTNHEFFGFIQQVVRADFSVNVLTVSTGASAVLRPQFSTNGGANWFDVCIPTGSCDITINFIPGPFSSGQQTIPAALQTSTADVLFRVVGIGGGGVGDNPSFSNIQIQFAKRILQNVTLCVMQVVTEPCWDGSGSNNSCGSTSFLPTKTQICVYATISFPPFSTFDVNIRWEARFCINGGSAC